MGFILRNNTAGSLAINDLGITLGIGEDYDLTQDNPAAIAQSAQVGKDLYTELNTGNASILDPLDDSTPLGTTDSVSAAQGANNTHYRIKGGTLNQLDDVVTTGVTDGQVIYYNGTSQLFQVADASNVGGGVLGFGDWKYSTTTTPPPISGQYRFNNADPELATKLYIHYTNDGGDDLTNFLNKIGTGSLIYSQLRSDSENGYVTQVSAFTDQTTYAEYDITDTELLGTSLQNNKRYATFGSIASSFADIPRQQVLYVGKHGNDVNSGTTPSAAKLTFGAAITVAIADTPSTTNRYTIYCEDSGIYAESFTVPSFVSVEAVDSKIEGTVTLSDDSEITIREVAAAINTSAVIKTTGTGSARVNAEILRATGTGDTITNQSGDTGQFLINARQVFTEDGSGVYDDSTAPIGHIHVEIEDLYITGTGSGLDRNSSTGLIIARVAHLLEIGGGPATGIAITDGTVDAVIGFLDATTAYSVDAAGTLRLIGTQIVGTRTQTSGDATVDVLEANILRWTTVTGTFTPRRIGFVSIDTSGGTATMNLPTPPSDGDNISFRDALNTFGTNTCTVDAGAGNLIDDGGSGTQQVVLDVDGSSGLLIYSSSIGMWTFTRIQEEVAFSPDNVIYVTKNGSDTLGDGSFSNPYLTVKKGATEALVVADINNPTTVKVLDGIYDEVNPISVTGTNSEYVHVQGSEASSTIIRPTANAQPTFSLSSNLQFDGPLLSRLTLQGQDNGGTDYRDVPGGSLVSVSGNGTFELRQIDVDSGYVGIDAGNGTITTSQTINWTSGTAKNSDVNIDVKSSARLVGQIVTVGDPITTNVIASGTSNVDLANYDLCGDVTQTTQNGTGLIANDTANIFLNGGIIHSAVLGIQANDTSSIRVVSSEFFNNTTDFDQVDGTASVQIQGSVSKTKQAITDGANISLNYIDTDTGDFIVGNADATGDPGKEFRVRDEDGRIAIGDNATDANIASGGVGASRTVNLIDENGNYRVWRFTAAADQDPAVEYIKGINPINSEADGETGITAITAGTDTITIDVSGTAYNDPFDTPPGIDRTTLAERAFPAGRDIRVNGTASNDGDYVVSSSSYNSGPETIDVVVTADITVTEGAVGTMVFGGGAGRPDGVSTYVDDPAGAVGAGVGNVWWDNFLQEDDYFVIRRRTSSTSPEFDEKVRHYLDHHEFLGSTVFDGADNELILSLETVADADNYLVIHNADATGPEIEAVGASTDIDIELIPKGTGTIIVPSGYEANVVGDSLVTKTYADSAGSIKSTYFYGHNAAVTQTFTTALTTINFATNIRSDADYTAATVVGGTEVTINKTGTNWYEITYDLSLDSSTGTSRSGSQSELQLNTVMVAGTYAFGYHRNAASSEDTMSCTRVLQLTLNDVIRVQAVRISGTDAINTIADGCRLKIALIDAP